MKVASKAEKDRMAALSRAPCIVCYLMFNTESPAEVHHLVEARVRLGHKFTIPLCFPHHRQGLNTPACVSIHPYKAEFVRRYGSELFLLEETNKLIEVYY